MMSRYKNNSLLATLLYNDYEKALHLTIKQCEAIVKLANLRKFYNINLHEAENPGKLTVECLNNAGYSANDYKKLISEVLNSKIISTYYRPQSKVAILIANSDYIHLGKLATPATDCQLIALILQKLGFITILITNTISSNLKEILRKTLAVVPENSYCLVFYAGHGCEICNTKCLLGIDSPNEDIELSFCVTENYILEEISKCKPELCIMIMDMCRNILDRSSHPKIYTDITTVENYNVHNNLIICYTTKSSASAYEAVEIEFSKTMDIPDSFSYALQPGDSQRIVQGTSQYVKALCARLEEDLDLSSLLDKVHEDLEKALRIQTPIKVQCGVIKHSLYDAVEGDTKELRNLLKSIWDNSVHCKVDLLVENDIEGTTILLDP